MRAMITGAAGGLGRVMAAECARRGYDLFLTDLTAEPLECLKEGLRRRFSVQIDVFPCDLTDPSQVTKMFQSVDQAGFRFDLLLNIAGVDGVYLQPCEHVSHAAEGHLRGLQALSL